MVTAIVLLTVVTLLLTLLPSSDLNLSQNILSYDKLGHFLLFGCWTFLIGYYWHISKPDKTNLLFIFIAGVVFGGIVEGIQGIPPFNRDPSVYDWIADCVGAFCSALLIYLITEWIKK